MLTFVQACMCLEDGSASFPLIADDTTHSDCLMDGVASAGRLSQQFAATKSSVELTLGKV